MFYQLFDIFNLKCYIYNVSAKQRTLITSVGSFQTRDSTLSYEDHIAKKKIKTNLSGAFIIIAKTIKQGPSLLVGDHTYG